MIVVAKSDAPSVPVWFAQREEITVLALMLLPSGGPKFLLWSRKQSSVGLFSIFEFEILDPAIPPEWVAKTSPSGQFELSPAEWQLEGFWERYHDADTQAIRTFEKCMAAIGASHDA